MSLINPTAQEMTGKIVYYGPGLGGKTTNLEQIYAHVAQDKRGQMTSISTAGERTLFFDLLAIKTGKISNYKLNYQLYTVPGQTYYSASRRRVLEEVDGVVFVADSQPERLEANQESLRDLYQNLETMGIDHSKLPMVMQYNKRDLEGALDIPTLQEALNFDDMPAFQAIAPEGSGVFATLEAILASVEASLRARYSIGV